MSERRDGLRPGRDAATLVGDAVMSSLEDLLARLRDVPPPERAATTTPAAVPSPTHPAAVVDFVGSLVAAIVPAVLNHIDPDVLLDRVDVQRIVDRVDVQELVARVDVNDVVDRLDIDAVVQRVDLEAVTREALQAVDIGDLVRESTATIGSDIVEGTRSQSMRADALLARGIDRVLGRREPRRTALPAGEGAP